ncbi:MAG: DNA polymerase IV [Lentisphaeraceae bacterium]|nr:DNA polymerase IV [Lentisphaeraceae bacterium]
MRKIIHIDMDCFYAAIEMRDKPELRNKAVAVGGRSRRSVLCTANYEARKYGVRSAMPSSMALQKCPHLVIVPVNFEIYREESRLIFEIFRDYTDLIQNISLDEAFLDVSDCKKYKGSATLIAQEIRHRIYEQRNITASAGIAPNKFLAKIASDWEKPNGQFVVTPDAIDDFVKDLKVEKIWGVGKKTAERLHGLGLYTCEDVQKVEKADLAKSFGKFGGELYNLARGIDYRPVENKRRRKSYSQERTFENDLTQAQCHEEFKVLIRRLFTSLENFLLKNGDYKVKTAFVKVKFNDFQSTTVERAWQGADDIFFHDLLQQGLERSELRVRLLGAGVKFYDESDASDMQLDFLDLLFGEDTN